ncbi:MAG TPA: flagellar motor switch protein FliM [Steroidobacteraceae bacterium]|nr:flagellar motor switch protein FliM [Steroidobacteraceae bacterium]
MASDVLNQDEIDALLKGVDNGAVETESAPGEKEELHLFDLATQVRIVRGRMPTLEMINERFARLLRIGMFNMIRLTPEIAVAPVQVQKFSEYLQTLELPASLNMVKVNPLRGTSLVVLDSKLVFAVVDHFFGGSGRHAKIEGREFTQTETRVIRMVLAQVFSNLHEAWAPVAQIEMEFLNSEINPHFANIVSPSELVVVTTFRIDFEGARGQLQVAMPYSMLEPLRESLSSGVQSDRTDQDEKWNATLREEVELAPLTVVPLLGSATVTVAKLVDLKPGDVIPCDFNGEITLCAEGVPVFMGTLGVSRGMQAVKITRPYFRPKRSLLADAAVSRP